jgi:hypothetical protein
MPLQPQDLRCLSTCTQLSCLTINICQWPKAGSNSSPLTGLASLSQLTVDNTDLSIASGLTQLTSLTLNYLQAHIYPDGWASGMEAVVSVLSGMVQLQELGLTPPFCFQLDPALVQPTICTSAHLRRLTLQLDVDQDLFDALLTHASQLT